MYGKIALCSHGEPGLITAKRRRRLKLDGSFYWSGINLETLDPWRSRSPQIIGDLSEFIAFCGTLKDWIEDKTKTCYQEVDKSGNNL